MRCRRFRGIRLLVQALLLVGSSAVAWAQEELPPGEGREVVVGVCTQCHGLGEFAKMRLSREDWTHVVAGMVGRGAEASEQDVTVAVDYLSRYLSRPESYPFDHAHVTVPDIPQAVEWYVTHLGGTRGKLPDQVAFGKALVVFRPGKDAPGSAGSAVDHIAISYADLPAKMNELQAGGVKILGPARQAPGLPLAGFVEDPWGTKIEVLQDAALLGFHHIHLRAADPGSALQWIAETFRGKRGMMNGRLDGVDTGSIWVLAERGEGEIPPIPGRSIDHLGWRVTNLDSAIADLKARGVSFAGEPRRFEDRRIVYLQTPAGLRMEIVERFK